MEIVLAILALVIGGGVGYGANTYVSKQKAQDNDKKAKKALEEAKEEAKKKILEAKEEALKVAEEAKKEEQKENEAKKVANEEKYGYSHWYDWCLGNWGTKWDIDTQGTQIRHANKFGQFFSSAWSPPIDFYVYLKEQGYEIDASYFESGMGFCGHWTSSHGDDYYQIEEFNSKWIEENIPDDIVSEFNLLENYANDEDDDEVDEDDVLKQIIAE